MTNPDDKSNQAVIWIGGTIIAILLLMTAYRNEVWSSDLTLREDVVSKSPMSARAHLGLGGAYKDLGRLNEAMHEYQIVADLSEHHPDAASIAFNYAQGAVLNMAGIEIDNGYTDRGIERMMAFKGKKSPPFYAQIITVLVRHSVVEVITANGPTWVVVHPEDLERSIQLADEGDKIGQENEKAALLFNKAEALRLLKRCAESTPVYVRARNIDPNLPIQPCT